MNVVGPDPIPASELARDVGRAIPLFVAAPEGEIGLATRMDGAFARAALAVVQAGRSLRPLDPMAAAEHVSVAGLGLLLREPGGPPWPDGPPVLTVSRPARPPAWARLMGRAAAPDPAFPGCLAGMEPGPGRAGGGVCGKAASIVDARVSALSEAIRLDGTARVLSLLPWSHADATITLLAVDRVGATLVRVPHGSDAVAVLDSAYREKVTAVVGTPGQLAELVRAGEELRDVFDPARFRGFVSVGGAARQLAGWPVAAVEPLIDTPESAVPATVEDIPQRLIAVAAAVLREAPSRLHMYTQAADVAGWTSIAHLDLVVAVEQEFGIAVTGSELARIRSLADFARLIESRG